MYSNINSHTNKLKSLSKCSSFSEGHFVIMYFQKECINCLHGGDRGHNLFVFYLLIITHQGTTATLRFHSVSMYGLFLELNILREIFLT